MTLLREVMSRHFETVDPDLTMKEAAFRVQTLNLSLMLVCRDHRVVGVLKESELHQQVASSGRDPATAFVRDFMSRDVLSGREEQDVKELVPVMRQRNIHTIPVLDEKARMVGVFTLGGPWKRSLPGAEPE